MAPVPYLCPPLLFFSYISNQTISIVEVATSNCDLAFRRVLCPVELGKSQDLTTLFPVLSDSTDRISWPHSSLGKFSIKSLYSKIVSGRHTSRFKAFWQARIPLKIKKYWHATKHKLPATDQIIKHNGIANTACSLCGEREDMEHIIFKCVISKFGRSCVRSWSNCNYNPLSFLDHFKLHENLLDQSIRVFWISFAPFPWSF